MTITKEKNLISITTDENKTYVIDVNTGNFIGLRGAPIKTFPPCRNKIARELCGRNSNLYDCLAKYISNDNSTAILVRNLALLQVAEKLDAVGLYENDLYYRIGNCYDIINKHFAIYVAEAKKAKEAGEYLNGDWHCRFAQSVARKAREKYIGEIANTFDDNFFSRFCDGEYEIYSKEEWSVVHYYWHSQYLEEFSKYANRDRFETYLFMTRLRQYLDYCKDLNKKPNKQPNFVREFVETRREWVLRKTEFDNAKIKANYEKQAKAFEFAYGDFVVVVPSCAKDIIDEGANMHHCVGGYVNSVIDNDTYIVFVRHKNTPDKCYLTAQVNPSDGRLEQYYLAHDRRISSEEDKDFQKAFSEHLRRNWI